MENAKFLVGVDDLGLRGEIWEIFQKSESQAMQMVRPEDWVEIIEVKACNRNWWDTSGKIGINATRSDKAVISHEVFHSAFHKCVFHDGANDERWGEGFCDAFRFLIERDCQLQPESGWLQKIDRFCAMSPAEILARPDCGDRRHDSIYGIPASRIILHSNKSMDGFVKLWQELEEERRKSRRPILKETFKFDPAS